MTTPELTDEERGLWCDLMDVYGKTKAVLKLRERTGLSLPEAVALLADRTGITLDGARAARDAQRQREAALVEALQAAVDLAHRGRAGAHNCMLITADAPCDECRWLTKAAVLGVVPRSP